MLSINELLNPEDPEEAGSSTNVDTPSEPPDQQQLNVKPATCDRRRDTVPRGKSSYRHCRDTINERVAKLRQRRRDEGKCVKCEAPIDTKWDLCLACRKRIRENKEQREDEKRRDDDRKRNETRT